MGNATNRRTVTIARETFDIEASVAAEGIYADEFAGRLKAPYIGVLEDDLLQLYAFASSTITMRVKADKKGRPVKGEDGGYVPVTLGGVEVEVPNPAYRGVDATELLRIVWAMAVAAESVTEPWGTHTDGDELRPGFERMLHADVSAREISGAYAAVVGELGVKCIFRKPEGPDDATDGDAGQQAEDGGED